MTLEALPKLDRYNLIRRLATGGMAEVYVGQRVGPGGFQKRVAIKFLMPGLAADHRFLEMFLDEARLVALFQHPNLVEIFDVGEIDGRVCMVMEYMDGGSLAQLFRQAMKRDAGRFPPSVALSLLAQACDGLETAHTFKNPVTGEPLGFIHRDISPHNLLLTRDGLLKVADFGIAKSSSHLHVTAATELKGKIAYMAPEQIHRAEIDRRVDVWALGVVLYELLAGRRLFSGTNAPQLIKSVLETPLEEALEAVSEDLRPLVRLALERDPERRIGGAGAFGRQLRGWLEQHQGSLDKAGVARWMEPFLPPLQSDDFTASRPPLLEPPEEVVSLSSGDVDSEALPTGETASSPRRRVAAGLGAGLGLIAVLAVTGGLVWRELRAPKEPAEIGERPEIAVAPIAPAPEPAPSSQDSAPTEAPPSGLLSDLTRSPTPVPETAIGDPVHPARPLAHRSSHRAAHVELEDPEGDDDNDVGLVNPFRGK